MAFKGHEWRDLPLPKILRLYMDETMKKTYLLVNKKVILLWGTTVMTKEDEWEKKQEYLEDKMKGEKSFEISKIRV